MTSASDAPTTESPQGTEWISFQTTSFVREDVVTGLETPRTLLQLIFETLTLVLMWLVAVGGNIIVCIVIYRSRRLQSTTNYFVVSLASADIVLGLFAMPFIVGRIHSDNRWVFGAAMCKIVRYVQYVCPGVTMYILVCICIDRYYTIIYPLSFKVTRNGAKKLILASWVLNLILPVPLLYFFNLQTSSNEHYCLTFMPLTWQGTLFASALITAEYLVPIVVLTVGYTRVFNHIWTVGVGGRTFQRTTNPVPRAKVKIFKMLLIVNVNVIVLISPFYCVQIWHFVTRFTILDPTIFITTTWFAFFAGMAKPLLYLIYNSNFRRGCKEVFCMSTMKCYRSNTYAITTTSRMAKKNHVGLDTSWTVSRQVESPRKTFNRAKINKTAWPLLNGTPNTYV